MRKDVCNARLSTQLRRVDLLLRKAAHGDARERVGRAILDLVGTTHQEASEHQEFRDQAIRAK